MSKRRKTSRGASPVSTGQPYGVAVPPALHDAIETERANLARAESLLGCLVLALESDSTASAPYYPDVAQLARELVKHSIQQLDCLSLQRLLRDRVKEDHDPRPGATPPVNEALVYYGRTAAPRAHPAGWRELAAA